MRKMRGTKLISAIVSVALVTSLNPAAALADEGTPSSGSTETPSVVAAQVDSGSAASKAMARSRGTGSIADTRPIKGIHDANEARGGLRPQATLPGKYSSVDKGYVTPVRDQGDFGICWSFSTIAAIESSMLVHKQGSNANSLDLSDRHLAYFTYHNAADPLGNTAGDFTTAVGSGYGEELSDPYLSLGANNTMTMYNLATWQGAVNENVAPYQDLEDEYQDYYYWGDISEDQFLSRTKLNDNIAYAKDTVHLENAYMIPASDRADVKQAIIDHGAAAVAVNTSYMNTTQSALYCDEYSPSTDHGVTIVGWDDSYSRSNFGGTVGRWGWFGYYEDELPQPSSNGAWLVKNSWGKDVGENGYFWLSYEDTALSQDWSRVYVYDVGTAANFDNIYQYDGTTSLMYNYLTSGGEIANVFTAKGNTASGGGESLKAVSFALDDTNVGYSVQVYLDPDSSDPTSGTAMLASPVTGTTTYEGYYTVKLPDPVLIPNGKTYSVVVTLTHSDGSDIQYSVDASYDADWVKFDNNVSFGQSFARTSSSETWHDLASSTELMGDDAVECSARLKAFTSDISASEYQNALNQKISGVTFAGATTTYDGEAHSLEVGGKLAPGVEVSYSGNDRVSAGIYPVAATFSYAGNSFATKTATLTINKATQSLKVAKKQLKKTVKYKKLQKKKRFTSKVKVKGAKGKVTYKKKSGSKKLSIKKKSGKVKVKKGTKKGTYKMKVKIASAATDNYLKAVKTVKVKVRVK